MLPDLTHSCRATYLEAFPTGYELRGPRHHFRRARLRLSLDRPLADGLRAALSAWAKLSSPARANWDVLPPHLRDRMIDFTAQLDGLMGAVLEARHLSPLELDRAELTFDRALTVLTDDMLFFQDELVGALESSPALYSRLMNHVEALTSRGSESSECYAELSSTYNEILERLQ